MRSSPRSADRGSDGRYRALRSRAAAKGDRFTGSVEVKPEVLDLLQNQRVIDAANDPVLANRFKKFDLQRALEYAGRGNCRLKISNCKLR